MVELGDVEAILFPVLLGPIPKADTSSLRTPLQVLHDPESRLAAAFDLAQGGLIVVGPDGRVEAVLSLDELTAAVECAREIHGRSKLAVIRDGAPVLIIPGVLEAKLCARLITYWEAGEKLHDRVASGQDAADAGYTRVKRRSDVVVTDKPLFELLQARLLSRVLPAMRRAYGFEAASFEALRVGCYDGAAGGHFARHRDNSTLYTAHRRFAMSLNLNTGAYEGGQLRFPEFGRQLYEAPAGGAVIFSCFLLHEALPVTHGRRFAVFTFFTDAAGAARERKLKDEEMAKGRQGFAMR